VTLSERVKRDKREERIGSPSGTLNAFSGVLGRGQSDP